MSTFQRFKALAFLTATCLILVQCTQKTSAQYIQEGLEFLKNARYDDALFAYQKAAQADSKNPDAYYGMGGVYNQKEKYTLAEKAFLKTLQYDPTYVDAYFSLGYTYEMLGKKEDAKKYYEKYRSLGKKLNQLLKKKHPKH
tara:strand:- start:1677 stop:2099 length:423 start_codon:yes stop_codon:yes gene_type:complete